VLSYVVMLGPPHRRLISVPADRNGCVRADVCFEEWPYAPEEAWAQPCVQAAAHQPRQLRPKLRFAVGDSVVCLTAGSDGLDWPRRWSTGTVRELWHHQVGAPEGSAVPYAVALDRAAAGGWPRHATTIVLVHRDEHQQVRALALQPAGQCASGVALARFTQQSNPEHPPGWTDKVDQQTLRVRKERAIAEAVDASLASAATDAPQPPEEKARARPRPLYGLGAASEAMECYNPSSSTTSKDII
jgi:hypothetical protein